MAKSNVLISGAKSPQRDRAAQFYVQCGCKVEARTKAGFKESKNEHNLANKLFNAPDMVLAVEYYQALARKTIDVTGEAILKEVAALAFSNMGDFVEALRDGVKDPEAKEFYTALSKIDRSMMGAVQELKVKKTWNVATETYDYESSIKLYNKWGPLKHIADIAGKLRPDTKKRRGEKKVVVDWRNKTKQEGDHNE